MRLHASGCATMRRKLPEEEQSESWFSREQGWIPREGDVKSDVLATCAPSGMTWHKASSNQDRRASPAS